MPIIFSLVITFVIWFQYEKHKASKEEIAEKEAFLKRESKANLTRRKDISKLPYIELSTSELPLEKGTDEQTNQFIETFLSYTDKKMINLSEYSNTELKEQYGLANLASLSEYDDNFYSFTKLLNDWGSHLSETGHLTEAANVLEYAIQIKTEIAKTYVALASVYQKLENTEKIAEVKAAYEATASTPSPSILKELNKAALNSLIESVPETVIDSHIL